ncbi:hypothetical protein Nepgr_024746 [Nepenthes gracilis]|uniref:Uncharacterized protein n=1 Tax=Nepenthes gracilis TaxID=150966 RepID=A0AAD3XZ31_NEPGR|nr:hypothetical protein Nepgr_024746 [Nepenthes gracilis]
MDVFLEMLNLVLGALMMPSGKQLSKSVVFSCFHAILQRTQGFREQTGARIVFRVLIFISARHLPQLPSVWLNSVYNDELVYLQYLCWGSRYVALARLMLLRIGNIRFFGPWNLGGRMKGDVVLPGVACDHISLLMHISLIQLWISDGCLCG